MGVVIIGSWLDISFSYIRECSVIGVFGAVGATEVIIVQAKAAIVLSNEQFSIQSDL